MTIKRILARLDGQDLDLSVLAYAFQVAQRFGGRIDAVHVRFNATDLAAMAAQGPIVDVAPLAMALQESADRLSALARQHFDDWNDARSAKAPRSGVDNPVSATWQEHCGSEVEILARIGRLADLIVIGCPSAQTGNGPSISVEAALFDTGRPVLLVPADQRHDLFHRPIIAWNGSIEAARAVSCALPFLGAADLTGIYAAGDEAPGSSAQHLHNYLKSHDILSEMVTPDIEAESVGADLLDLAKRRGSGLIVMGAYTHGRLRQMVFGGVTRHIMKNAAVPILMAH